MHTLMLRIHAFSVFLADFADSNWFGPQIARSKEAIPTSLHATATVDAGNSVKLLCYDI